MRHYLSLLLFCLTFSHLASADELIIEPDDGRQPIIQTLAQAKHSIDLVMYGFTDKSLLHALLQQQSSGKIIRVILEEHPYKTPNENQQTITTLQSHHIAWHGAIPPFQLIHQKTLIMDGHKLLVMTFNFTHATFENERNVGLIIDDVKRAQDIEAIFSADWHHTPAQSAGSSFILSPDHSREDLLFLIHQAKHSLRIYAQAVSDYEIVGALAEAAKKGLSVQLLSSTHLGKKQANYLARAGVQVHYSSSLIIHAKVFIIDEEIALIGSINLTRTSLEDNRELSALTKDTRVIQPLLKTFDHDWRN